MHAEKNISESNTQPCLVHFPKALPRKKHLCQVCREMVSSEDKVQLDDCLYHLECYEQSEMSENAPEVKKENAEEDRQLDATKDNAFVLIGKECETEREDAQEQPKSLDQVVEEFNAVIGSLESDMKNAPIILKKKMREGEDAKLDNSTPDKEKGMEINQKNNGLVDVVEEEQKETADSREKIHQILDRRNSLEEVALKTEKPSLKEVAKTEEEKKDYPDHLNPFGSEEDEESDETEKRKIKTQNNKPAQVKMENKQSKAKRGGKEYPDHLNPFGSDEEEDEDGESKHVTLSSKKAAKPEKKDDYPDDLNPFADSNDEEEQESIDTKIDKISKNTSAVDDYDESLNPFADDDDDQHYEQQKSSTPSRVIPAPMPRISLTRINQSNLNQASTSQLFNHSSTSSPNRSLTPEAGRWKSNKKRRAPEPPTTATSSANASMNNSMNLGDATSLTSYSNPVTPEFKRRQSLASVSKQSSLLGSATNSTNNLNGRQFDSLSDADRSMSASFSSTGRMGPNFSRSSGSLPRSYRKKKKAPPIPIPTRRIVNFSLEELLAEVNEIGDRLAENQSALKELERRFEANCNELTKGKLKKMVFEYLNLLSVQCALAKRQEELMYLRREHKLEEEHAEIELRMRVLMNKREEFRTEKDEEEDQMLLKRLVDIIEERNEICENMMKIDKRNEFDISVDRLKQLTGDGLVAPVLEDFMKNCFSEKLLKNEQAVLNRTLKPNSSLTGGCVSGDKNKKSFTLKKIHKLAKFK